MAKRILLVDDSQSIRSLIQVFLMKHGYEFLEAETGERALGILKLVPADLVIVDVNMPGMGGLELVRQIRQHTKTSVRDTQVVLLTGDKDPDTRSKGLEVGANGFLSKPVSAEQLNQVVQNLLSAPPP